MTEVFGAIEAGGTKFVCAIGRGPDRLEAETRFLTATPGETFDRAIAFFREYRGPGRMAAIGIASFGPVDPNPRSPTFGYITSTPKEGWAHTDFAGTIQRGLKLPVAFDTDVNGAALGEHRWGSAVGLDSFLYITVGTGIGGGAMENGRLVHGLVHPEMGHLMIRHDRARDPFPGTCPYHGDCLEGLASGPALEKRWGTEPEKLPADHPAWELEAEYLAGALASFVYTLSPERIILGGGVMQQLSLFPRIRLKLLGILNGYIRAPQILKQIDSYVVPPGLGKQAGVLGALALAELAVTKG